MTKSFARERWLPTALLCALLLTPFAHAADTGGSQGNRRSVSLRSQATMRRYGAMIARGSQPATRQPGCAAVTNGNGHSGRMIQSAGCAPVALAGGLLIAAAMLAVLRFTVVARTDQVHGSAGQTHQKAVFGPRAFYALDRCDQRIDTGYSGPHHKFRQISLLPVVGYTLFSWLAMLARTCITSLRRCSCSRCR